MAPTKPKEARNSKSPPIVNQRIDAESLVHCLTRHRNNPKVKKRKNTDKSRVSDPSWSLLEAAPAMASQARYVTSTDRIEFLTEAGRQFPNMPEHNKRLATDWCLAELDPLLVGSGSSLSLSERVARGVHAYAEHFGTLYDLYCEPRHDLYRSTLGRDLIKPELDHLMAQWTSIRGSEVGTALTQRRSPRIAAQAAANSDAHITSVMGPELLRWLHSHRVLWPQSPIEVISETKSFAPALSAWVKAQQNHRQKSAKQVRPELTALVSDLLKCLVKGGFIKSGSSQSRITELGEDGLPVTTDDGASGKEVAISGARLPPDMECRRLMDAIAVALSKASHDQLLGSTVSLLCFVVAGATRD